MWIPTYIGRLGKHGIAVFGASGALLLTVLQFLVIAITAQAATKSIDIWVNNPLFLRIQTRHQSPELVITDADIRRGYVDVESGTRYFIQTNARGEYAVVFSPLPEIYRKVVVSDGAGEGDAIDSYRCVYLTYSGGRTGEEKTLDYRFYLDESVRPGTYPWPLAMTFDIH